MSSNGTILGTLFADFLVIIGGVISGLVGLIVERQSRRHDKRDKHLDNMKDECLGPLKNRLELIRLDLDFKQLGQDLQQPAHFSFDRNKWWQISSLNSRIDEIDNLVDPVLYSDLNTHFPELVVSLNNLQTTLQKEPDELLTKLHSFIDSLSQDFRSYLANLRLSVAEETTFQNLKPEWKNQLLQAILSLTLDNTPANKTVTMGLLAEGIYREDALAVMRKVCTSYSQGTESSELGNKVREIRGKIDGCLFIIDEVLHSSKLKGNCKYL